MTAHPADSMLDGHSHQRPRPPAVAPPSAAALGQRLSRVGLRLFETGRRPLERMIAREAHLPWLVLLLGLVLTGVFCEQNRRHGAQVHARIERALMDDVADAIAMKLREDVEMVNGVAGLFTASGEVSREDFRRYYEALRRDQSSLNGIQGLGFSRLVTAAERPQLENRVRAQGYPRFTITPAGSRPLYSTILYLEPFNLRNQRAFGFDMYSEPVRQEAMQRAAFSGMAAMSGKVRLRQENGVGEQPGVLIYVPIYRPGQQMLPTSPSEFGTALMGWAYSPIRVGDLVEAALRTVNNRDLPGSAVLLYDGLERSSGQLLFDSQALHGSAQLTDPQFQMISAGGRTWLVGIQLNRASVRANGMSATIPLIALIGGLASVVAAMATRLLVNDHQLTRSALKAAEEARHDLTLAAAVFEATPLGIVVTDPQGRVISANPGFARVTGFSGAEIIGRTLSLLKSGRHEAGFYADLWRTVQERGFWQGEIWNRLRSGEIRRHELSITAVRDQNLALTNYVGMLQDVSERHQAQEQIRHRSLHDPLTGLANRDLLMELADQALAVAERHHHSVALLYLDLDGFKPVNDRLGHAMGDRVLQLVASRVAGGLRDSDTLARLGGDEFVLLAPRSGSIEELKGLAAKIQGLVEGVNGEVNAPIELSVSIGIARSPEHGVTVGQLMAAADAAMYRAKGSREERIQVATPPAAAMESARV